MFGALIFSTDSQTTMTTTTSTTLVGAVRSGDDGTATSSSPRSSAAAPPSRPRRTSPVISRPDGVLVPLSICDQQYVVVLVVDSVSLSRATPTVSLQRVVSNAKEFLAKPKVQSVIVAVHWDEQMQSQRVDLDSLTAMPSQGNDECGKSLHVVHDPDYRKMLQLTWGLLPTASSSSRFYVMLGGPSTRPRRDLYLDFFTNELRSVTAHLSAAVEPAHEAITFVSPAIEGQDDKLYYGCYQKVPLCSSPSQYNLVQGYKTWHRGAMICDAVPDTVFADGPKFLKFLAASRFSDELTEARMRQDADYAYGLYVDVASRSVDESNHWQVRAALLPAVGILDDGFTYQQVGTPWSSGDLWEDRGSTTNTRSACGPGKLHYQKDLFLYMMAGLKLVEDFGKLDVAVGAGTLLSGIKLGASGPMPWDLDVDMHCVAKSGWDMNPDQCGYKEMTVATNCTLSTRYKFTRNSQGTPTEGYAADTVRLSREFASSFCKEWGKRCKAKPNGNYKHSPWRYVYISWSGLSNSRQHVDLGQMETFYTREQYSNYDGRYHSRDEIVDLVMPLKKVLIGPNWVPSPFSPGRLLSSSYGNDERRSYIANKGTAACASKWKECIDNTMKPYVVPEVDWGKYEL